MESSAANVKNYWIPWRTGMAFAYRGHTLMVMRQVSSESCDIELPYTAHLLQHKYRIEVHVYTNEWIKLITELLDVSTVNLECIPGLATKLLVMVTSHLHGLTHNFFADMLISSSNTQTTFMPCWKCYAKIGSSNPQGQ